MEKGTKLGCLRTHLVDFEWLRLVSVPRISEQQHHPRKWMSESVLSAVVAAHAEFEQSYLAFGAKAPPALTVAWVRRPGSSQLNFLVGGWPYFPPRQEAGDGSLSEQDEIPVLFPPGARANRVPQEEISSLFASIPSWVRCLGTSDVPSLIDASGGGWPSTQAAGLDEFATHLSIPFVWLIVAERATRADLESELRSLNAELTLVRGRATSEAHRASLAAGQRRARELTRARATGLWLTRVLAGASEPSTARQAASMLSAAADVSAHDFLLIPDDEAGSLASAWEPTGGGGRGAGSPFLGGSEILASLTRPPVRELPGIRAATPFRFDVTPTQQRTVGAALGEVLDEGLKGVGPLIVPYETLNRHGFICGATGSGKSQTARRLLESLTTGSRRIPWMVVEPAKAEYAAMRGRLGSAGEVLVIRPGDLDSPPASLNPLEPEPGFPLQSHADLVRALFLAAFQAEEPFPQVLSLALSECYTTAGWDLVSSRLRQPSKPKFRMDEPAEPVRHRYPTLRELQATARRVVSNVGYGREVAANIRGFVDVRIGSLRQGSPGRFFEGGHPLDISGLMTRNVVLELEPIASDQDKAFVMGTVLIRLVEHLRVRANEKATDGLQHLLLIEEAHRLLRNVREGPAAAAVELFASLLAEIRAYGEGVLIVEQAPSKLVSDVVKNTALKIMHRLPALDDREAVGATMNMSSDNSQNVVSLAPGYAAVSIDGDDHPLLVRVSGGMEREVRANTNPDPPLARRRSELCGSSCRERPCSLDEIARAAAAAEDPRVVVWAESVAASMILGRSAPTPRDTILISWPADQRISECALATLVERAVDARRVQLRRWVDPDDFASRLLLLLQGGVGRQPVPDDDVRRWQAGPFRWRQVYETLTRAIAAAGGPDAATECPPLPPHEWRSFGLLLDARSLAGQLDELRTYPAYAEGSERVVLGDTNASGLREAIIEIAGTEDSRGIEHAMRHACAVARDDKVLVNMQRLLDSRTVKS